MQAPIAEYLVVLCVVIACVQLHIAEGQLVHHPASNYTDYVVLRVDVTPRSYTLLQQYEKLPGVDFWNKLHPRAAHVDVMLSPQMQHQVRTGLAELRVSSTTLISDVQRAVDVTTGVIPESDVEVQTVSSNVYLHRDNDMFTKYHRMPRIQRFLRRISRQGNCRLVRLGKSTFLRSIPMMKCGTGSEKIIVEAGIHAREWISPAVALHIINELGTRQTQYSRLLSQYTIYIVPMLNPDGYEYTFTNDRMWRKSRNNNRGSICRGVDLNRNFAYKWSTNGASSEPCSDVYRGKQPESEREVRAMSRLIRKHSGNIHMYLSLHSYSQLVLLNYGYTSQHPRNYNEFVRVATVGQQAIISAGGPRFRVGTPPDVLRYTASGSSMDFALEVGRSKFSTTLELRDDGRHGFLLPPSYIKPSCKETMAAFVAMINTI